MTKKEVCKLLGISVRTLSRRIAAGQITCTKVGTGQYAELSFTHSDLGLPEPGEPWGNAPQRGQDIEINRQYEDTGGNNPPVPQVPDISEPGALDPTEFRDSFGHRISGNARHRMFETQHSPRPDLQAHMDPALLGTSGAAFTSAGDPSHPLNAGFKPLPTTTEAAPDWNARRRDVSRIIFAGVRQGWSR
jgi:excisionase family DNA binding protein